MNHEDKPHPIDHTRWLGRQIAFDYATGESVPCRLVGIVEAAEWRGYTERGHIPDWTLTVRGQSGKTVTVSLVESKASFPMS